MNSFTWSHLLLADPSDWKRMGDAFSEENAGLSQAEMLSLAAVAISAILLVWLLNRVATRQQNPRTYYRPQRLFAQLCRAHRLGRGQRKLLRRLAEHWQLEQPALLFIKPEDFAVESLPPELSPRKHEVDALRRRLFATGDRGPGR